MSKPLIIVATPCFAGQVTHSYMMSVLQLTQRAASGAEFDVDVFVLGGDSLISRARSVLVSHFLDNSRATHLLFVDADIAFDPDQFLRLLRFDKDFVAGMYPLKQINWHDLQGHAAGGEALQSAGLSYVGKINPDGERRVEDGFATGQYAGTGFQLLKRSVFERMIAAYPELKFKSIQALSNERPPQENLSALFDCMIDADNGTYLSEDFSFCRRWQAIGGEIWLDLHSKLTHAGTQYFAGDCAPRFASLTNPMLLKSDNLMAA